LRPPTRSMNDRIGEFLMKIGAMQSWQVEDVVLVQAAGDGRLFGEIAIELRYINDDALRKYIQYRDTDQRR
jgi:hypothetical protein